MHTSINVIWLGAFIVLLLINVAVVVISNISTGQVEGSPAWDAPLLAASDEVQLDWWAQYIPPGEGPSPLKPSHINIKPTATVVPSKEGDGETKDYPKLMGSYIKNLVQYLNGYFHITAYRIEEPGE